MSELDTIKRLVSIGDLLGTMDKQIHCPIPGHDDRNPSCYVNHINNSWYCFACVKGGDVFDLLMERDGLTFRQALERLADKAGVELGRNGQDYQERHEKQKRIQDARAYAVNRYHQNLLENHGGLLEWKNRGISLKTIEAAKLGFADGNLSREFDNKLPEGLSLQDFIDAGIICRNEAGSTYDYFMNRLIIPLLDAQGRVVNITGRECALDEGTGQKYKHLKNTPIKHFYNEKALKNDVWIFEGHSDTLTAMEINLPAIGVIGTSGMTCPEKLANCDSIYICPDNDTAGKKAVEKWVAKIREYNESVKIRLVLLPDVVKDFNEWVIKNKADTDKAFECLKSTAIDVVEFKISQVDTTDEFSEIWLLIENLPDLKNEHYFKLLKTKFPVLGLATIRKEFNSWKKSRLKTPQTFSINDIEVKKIKEIFQNQNFSVTDGKNVGQVCVYLDVNTVNSEGEKKTIQEPVIIRSTIDPSCPNGYKVEYLGVNKAEPRTIPLKSVAAKRWSGDSVKKFVKGNAITLKTNDLLNRIATFFDERSWYQAKDTPYILAGFVAHTYIARLFNAVPYLIFTGMRHTGKTRTLEYLEELCFNGIMSANVTISSMFRLVDSSFPTFIYDEAETFNNKNRSEGKEEEIGLLNSGYKPSGRVLRSEKVGDTFEPNEYRTFCPKVFGAINPLSETLKDRAIILNTLRAPKGEAKKRPKMNEVSSNREKEVSEIRDMLYIWALTNFHKVANAYEHLEIDGRINNREYEIWKPLLSIASIADEDEGSITWLERFERFALAKGKEKKEQGEEEDTPVKILIAAQALMEDHLIPQISVFTNPGYYALKDIASKVTESLRATGDFKESWELTPRQIGAVFRQTNIITEENPVKGVKISGKTFKSIKISADVIKTALENL